MKKFVLASFLTAAAIIPYAVSEKPVSAAPAPATSTSSEASASKATSFNIIDNDRYYVGIHGGIAATQSLKDVSDNSQKVNVGPSVGVKAGYHVDQYLTTEASFEYMHLRAPKGANNAVEAKFNDFSSFFNAIVTPFGNKLSAETDFGAVKFNPYLLAGLGAIYQHASLSGSQGKTTVNDLQLGANVGAGLNAKVSSFELGLGYRYVLLGLGGVEAFFKSGMMTTHVVSAQAAFNF